MNNPLRRSCLLFAFASIALLGGCQTAQRANWYLPAGVKTLSASGCPMAYVERGSGPTVVLVHGAINDYRYWNPQIESLPLSLPGYIGQFAPLLSGTMEGRRRVLAQAPLRGPCRLHRTPRRPRASGRALAWRTCRPGDSTRSPRPGPKAGTDGSGALSGLCRPQVVRPPRTPGLGALRQPRST